MSVVDFNAAREARSAEAWRRAIARWRDEGPPPADDDTPPFDRATASPELRAIYDAGFTAAVLVMADLYARDGHTTLRVVPGGAR